MSIFKTILIMAIIATLAACKSTSNDSAQVGDTFITETTISETINELITKYGENQAERIRKGVEQTAALWTNEDGTPEEFRLFCNENIVHDPAERQKLFETLSRNFEALWGHSNQISVEMNKALHLDWGPLQAADMIFAAYSPSAHFYDDFFSNKIAFITILNFPFYSLEEKNTLSQNWNRLDWAYARMGGIFISRVPAEISKEISRISTESDSYVSEYNIIMSQLRNERDTQLFPDGMKLITHWGLRDEIKSNYGKDDGLEKQQIIYQVMQRIINQDIPQAVINNDQVQWNPVTNEVFADGGASASDPEPNTRYEQLLNNFNANKASDPFNPNYPTYMERAFDQGLEMSMDEVELLFTELVSSPLVSEVGKVISERLGRELQPWDIWYDGFKARSSIPADYLNTLTTSRFPDAKALETDLPNILKNLGYSNERADYIASKVVVEGSRGAGHAWGAQMRSQVSRLRTRIPESGMDYKGFNIAIHEFGHNVEQTISLYDVDYYMMSGVPNTAFTEAMAFIYQHRDLKVLGVDVSDPKADYLNTLDNFWGVYEIMGVSLVDMAVWRWMYANPDATAAELKEQVIKISNEVWNKYFAPVFGMEDQPILAIYSHMISYPLYLAAYPIGHLIEFQIEQQIKGKNLATETDRMFTAGRLTPQAWMQNAVGKPLTNQPLLEAVEDALKNI